MFNGTFAGICLGKGLLTAESRVEVEFDLIASNIAMPLSIL